MNLYEKLEKVRKPVEVMRRKAKGYGYTYTLISDILSGITGTMEKQHVSLVPKIIAGTTRVLPLEYKKSKILKTGEMVEENVMEYIVTADMEYVWVDNENVQDTIVVPWTLVLSSCLSSRFITTCFMLSYNISSG